MNLKGSSLKPRWILSVAPIIIIGGVMFATLGEDTAVPDRVSIASLVDAKTLNPFTARLCNGLPYQCELPLTGITLPGNHNSGSGAHGLLTYCVGGGPAASCFYRNQGRTITEQLEFGIRYFDIDTCICYDREPPLHTCHGKLPIVNENDALGPPIEQILNELGAFLRNPKNRNEVVVITFGDQSPREDYDLQELLYEQLERWAPTAGRKASGELTIFDGVQMPGDRWPTLGELVETNQRIVVLVRDPHPSLPFDALGVLPERDFLFDTWRSRECTYSCNSVDDDTYDYPAEDGEQGGCVQNVGETAKPLTLASVFCSWQTLGNPVCLSDMARLCRGHLLESLHACRCGLLQEDKICSEDLWDRAPNFIAADWTQNDDHKPNIVQVVKYFNQQRLKETEEAEYPLRISKDVASYIGFESFRNGKMISAGSAGIRFDTQALTDDELWKYKKYTAEDPYPPDDLQHLMYGETICLQSKSNDTYLRSHDGMLYQAGGCRPDERWRLERFVLDSDPDGSTGPVQAGDRICLYSVQDNKFVRAYDDHFGLQGHCATDEMFVVHAGWDDTDADRVVDEGDNCPYTYNPDQEDSDGDGVGDFCEENLLVNGTFDVDIDGWVPSLDATWSSHVADDVPGYGSVRLSGFDEGCITETCAADIVQCVPASESETYILKGKLYLPSPNGETPALAGQGGLLWFSDASCEGDVLGEDYGEEISEIGSWIPYEIRAVSPPGTQSVLVFGDIEWSGLPQPAIIYYDDQFLTVPEPHAVLLQVAVIGCLAILTRRRRGAHRA